MPNRLRKLKIKTIGFVDKGANGASPVVLWKRHNQEQKMPDLNEKILKSLDELQKTIRASIAKEGAQSPQELFEASLEGLPDDRKAAIMSAYVAAQQAIPPAPAAPSDKAEGEGDKPEGEGDKPAIPEEKAEGDKPEPPKGEEDMSKALEKLPKEARVAIEKMQADAEIEKKRLADENAKLAKRLDETEDIIAKQRAEAEHAEMVEVAKRFPHAPGDIEERAVMLSKMKRADDNGYKALVETLEAAEELAKKGITEKGSSRGGDDNDASAQLDNLAKKRASEKGIAFAKAYRQVVGENRGLYNESQKDMQ